MNLMGGPWRGWGARSPLRAHSVRGYATDVRGPLKTLNSVLLYPPPALFVINNFNTCYEMQS